jgi:hypothetical protein
MTNNYGGSDGGYYWANSESDSEVVVRDFVIYDSHGEEW